MITGESYPNTPLSEFRVAERSEDFLVYYIYNLRWDSRAGTRPGARVPGLEMPWNPGTALL
jgi:hypothetical protein